MTRVYVSVGSNIDKEKHIRAAVKQLRTNFGELILSSVYESHAVGFAGENFFNMVVGLDCELPVHELAALLRDIEQAQGRSRDAARFSARTLDLDLLLYGDAVLTDGKIKLPRDDIAEYSFVLCPLAEIAPDLLYPLSGVSYAVMWREFTGDRTGLWSIPFSFDE